MTASSLERPDSGARLLVRLGGAGSFAAAGSAAPSVAYALAVATRAATWEGSATVTAESGEVAQRWAEGAPPAWLEQALHALLRSAWQRHRAGHGWPRRLSRWRPGPGELEV